MPTNQTAVEMLDRNFLETRHHVLDIAAALDRIDRAGEVGEARSDPRFGKLEEALRVLIDGKSDRAERIQMVFSLPYDANWKSEIGVVGK